MSDGVPGRIAERRIPIRLVDGPVSSTLVGVKLTINVAGQTHVITRTRAQALATPVHTFTWNGQDAYGRPVLGTQDVEIDLAYEFEAVYQESDDFRSSWARVSGGNPIGTARGRFSLSRHWTTRLASFDMRGVGLGGWMLSGHHVYDPGTRVIRLGSGGASGAAAQRMGAIETLPASSPALDGPTAITTDATGAVWIADTRRQQIRRRGPDGTVSTVAGTGAYGYRASDDGGAATAARLSSPQGVAVVDGGERGPVVYVADTQANRVRRIGGDGRITTVAGGGTTLGDGGPATSARLHGPTAIAVAPEGSLFIADTNGHRIRQVGTDGTITTVAGTGASGLSGDGGPAAAAKVRAPAGIVVDADGRVLFSDTGNRRVRRINTDGTIETIVGGGTPADDRGDGRLGPAAELQEPLGLALRASGELLIADAAAGRVRKLGADGIVTTLAGGGTEPRRDGAPGTSVPLTAPTGVAADGELATYITEPEADRIARAAEPMPGFADGDSLIPGPDGSEVYQFNASGRHLRTLDARTGAVLRRFTYDGAGRLTAVHDDAAGASPAHDALLTIDRSTPGRIVLRARHDRETVMKLDANGYADAVTNPAGEKHELTHAADGLLTGEEDAEGGTHTFTYDGDGRLVSDTGPDGKVQTLTRTEIDGGRLVTVTTGGGQVTKYRVVEDELGQMVRTTTHPNGAASVSTRRPDGSIRLDTTTGMVVDFQVAPDPRFGGQLPYVSREVTTTPGGRTSVRTVSRTVSMRDAVRVQTQAETVTVDGKATTQTFTARPGDDGGTVTTVTPAGRTSTMNLDDHGRVTSSRQAAGRQPLTFAFDDAQNGRLSSAGQGARTRAFAYDAQDRITSRTDAEGVTTTYTYDDADRVLTRTTAGSTYTFTYDDAGRRTSVTTPGGRTTAFTTTPGGLADTMSLPGTAAYEQRYTLDSQSSATELPTGATIATAYDATKARTSGREAVRDGETDPVTSTSFTYLGATDRLDEAQWTDGTATQTTEAAYDGDVPTGMTMTGAAEGTITHAVATTGLRYASTTIDAGAGAPATYALTRDNDDRVTAQGPFTITRSAATGYGQTYRDAANDTTLTHTDGEGYGDVDRRRLTKAGDELYDLQVERDDLGRVVRREERIDGGAAIVRTYAYDTRGRLETVGDGTGTVEAYAYDASNDRTSARSEDHAAQPATYAAGHHRQTAAGPLAMSFDADGFLTERGGHAFVYSPTGELLSAETPGGTVAYAYDAMGRLVERRRGGDRTAFLYGDPDDAFAVTATVDEAGVRTTYFYDDVGHLHGFERGGARFRVGSDQVGSPRVVVDAAGAVVKQLDRDTWGRVLADSAPSFELPIGYAGGLADPWTGLVRMGARDYDPETGRWTSRDPSFYQGSADGLFVYANNAPSDRRDPSGLWSVGGSFYEGIGGGASVQYADGSFGFCIEAGVGVGAGVELDPMAEPADSDSMSAEVGASAGFHGITAAIEASDCPEEVTDFHVKASLKATAGPLSVAVDSDKGITPTASTDIPKAEVGIGAKAAYKKCFKFSAWW
jgi:RHS repeat-associated protein